MKFSLLFLFVLNFIILLISLGTLACHVVQLVLLSQIPNTGQWWPSYKPYTFYYTGSILSILSSTLLILIHCIHLKSLWIHRIVATVNLSLTIAFIVYNTLESGIIPWTGQVSKSITTDMKGFATYCSSYSNDQNTFLRCWMTNGTWLGMIIYGFFWLLCVLCLMVMKNSDLKEEEYDSYDYKNDVPMVNTSSPDYYNRSSRDERSRILLQESTLSPTQSSIQPPHSFDNNKITTA